MITFILYFAALMIQSEGFLLTTRPPSQEVYICDPYLDCLSGGIGALVPDPENCRSYYICVNSGGEQLPSDMPIYCPTKQYFDQITGSCIEELEPCTNKCYKFCNLECTEDYQLVAYPGDCSKYYICFTGETKVEMDCPITYPYFNGTECANNQYQCCDSCIPHCTESYVEIADPFDCQSFYICLETGLPSEDYHGKCAVGEHFDSATNVCVNGTECTSICGVSATTVRITQTSSLTTI